MSTTFRPCAPDQSLLFPPSPRDWLPEGQLAFFIADTVAAVDLQVFYAPYEYYFVTSFGLRAAHVIGFEDIVLIG